MLHSSIDSRAAFNEIQGKHVTPSCNVTTYLYCLFTLSTEVICDYPYVYIKRPTWEGEQNSKEPIRKLTEFT
jgi:hypothetical protein